MHCKVKWLNLFVSGSKSISHHTEGGPPDSESQNVVRSPKIKRQKEVETKEETVNESVFIYSNK